MLRKIITWPYLSTIAAEKRKPHLVAHFLYDIASDFNVLYSKKEWRVFEGTYEEKTQKVLIIAVFVTIIRSVMDVLGIEPVFKM